MASAGTGQADVYQMSWDALQRKQFWVRRLSFRDIKGLDERSIWIPLIVNFPNRYGACWISEFQDGCGAGTIPPPSRISMY